MVPRVIFVIFVSIFFLLHMATNRTYLGQFAKVIRDHKRANGGMQVARHVLPRVLLVDVPDRLWFSNFFRKKSHVDWLETTCLITIVSKGNNRQLFLCHDSQVDVLTGLDDPTLPPPPHDLRPPVQPVAAAAATAANANANDDHDDSEDDSDFAPGRRDDSDDGDDSDDDEEDDNDEENNLPRPMKLDSIFLERLRFRQVKPDTQRRILNVVLTGIKYNHRVASVPAQRRAIIVF